MHTNEINALLNDRAYERLASYYDNFRGGTPKVSDVAISLGITERHVKDLARKYQNKKKRERLENNESKVVKYYEGFAGNKKPSCRAMATRFGLSQIRVRQIIKCHKTKKSTKTEENVPAETKNVTPKVWHHDKTPTASKEKRTLIDLTNE